MSENELGLSSQANDAERRRAADRRRRRAPRFVERRSGFDRRRDYRFTAALRDDPVRLFVLIVIANCLSALDFLFTLAQLRAGVATEANPVLAGLFAADPAVAWAFKSSVMLVVSLVIWLNRRHRMILTVALLMLAIYTLLVMYHVIVSGAIGLI